MSITSKQRHFHDRKVWTNIPFFRLMYATISPFKRVRVSGNPIMIRYQALLSIGFSFA